MAGTNRPRAAAPARRFLKALTDTGILCEFIEKLLVFCKITYLCGGGVNPETYLQHPSPSFLKQLVPLPAASSHTTAHTEP